MQQINLKNKWKRSCQSRRRIYCIHIKKVIKSLEDLHVLIDEVTETGKDKIKQQESWFLEALLAPFAASLVQPVISSVGKDISGKGVRKAGRGYINKIF